MPIIRKPAGTKDQLLSRFLGHAVTLSTMDFEAVVERVLSKWTNPRLRSFIDQHGNFCRSGKGCKTKRQLLDCIVRRSGGGVGGADAWEAGDPIADDAPCKEPIQPPLPYEAAASYGVIVPMERKPLRRKLGKVWMKMARRQQKRQQRTVFLYVTIIKL